MPLITPLIVVFVLLGVVLVIKEFGPVLFSAAAENKTAEDSPSEPQYRVKPSIMNKSEQAFFYELQKQLPTDYHIFPNMRIADILEAVDGKGFYKRRNEILPKHVDFLVCDRYFKPMVAIEVNGSSHLRTDRIESDDLKQKIFKDAQLPLEVVDVGTSFEQSVLRIKALLPA